MEDLGNVQPKYVPSELVNCSSNSSKITYNCYLIELEQDYKYEVSVNDIVLAMRSELDSEITDTTHVMCVDRGNLTVKHRHVGTIHLSPDQVHDCRRFQITLFRILLIQDVNELTKISDDFSLGDKPEIDYLLLPATAKQLRPSDSIIDWKSVYSFPFTSESNCECEDHAHNVWTIDDLVCSCKLKNCVVFTPHKPNIYIITGMMELNGNSRMRYNQDTTYKEYFKNKHGIELQSEHQSLLCGRKVFKVTNCLIKNTQQRKQKGRSMSSCELPPELCSVIMSPISMSTIYSFSFVPSIMHWLESLLLAFNLKKILSDHCTQDNEIPICKVLEAITAKECQVDYDYDSLETLGDSFLKYIVSQQLFKTYQNHKEGLLTEERMNIISNYALFKYGCSRKLQGFIRKEKFEPKQWEIPGDRSKGFMLEEELVSSTTKVYVGRTREMDFNVIADVVEALIGAFLSTKNEEAALSFLNWIGIKVDTNFVPYKRHLSIAPEKLVEVKLLESKLKYWFQDPSILVEALTHGSFKRPEIPSCYNYQRLEFLGDAVLDFLVTMHFYNECPVDKPSSQYLTEMRSDSVKNQFFAKSVIKANLHEHILCDSEVKKKIAAAVENLETDFCKVVADVIESIAGAIYVDSGYKKEAVFQSIAPLLELVTPETMKHDPFDELQKPSQKEHNSMKEPPASRNSTVASVTIEGKVDGIVYENTGEAVNKDTTQKIASDELLKLTKIC